MRSVSIVFEFGAKEDIGGAKLGTVEPVAPALLFTAMRTFVEGAIYHRFGCLQVIAARLTPCRFEHPPEQAMRPHPVRQPLLAFKGS